MKKVLVLSLVALFAAGFIFSTSVLGADIELAKKSTVEKILKRGELRVGFESGYIPFEMTDKKGNFIGFDMDFARRMAKEMGVKFVPVNTEWDGIIPALMTDKFDIIMGGMTITQERNLKINFSDPYIVVGQTI
ncbi:MAG: transporter substrate-binding domain-containing protein, partial [Desulfobacterales bacterium]